MVVTRADSPGFGSESVTTHCGRGPSAQKPQESSGDGGRRAGLEDREPGGLPVDAEANQQSDDATEEAGPGGTDHRPPDGHRPRGESGRDHFEQSGRAQMGVSIQATLLPGLQKLLVAISET